MSRGESACVQVCHRLSGGASIPQQPRSIVGDASRLPPSPLLTAHARAWWRATPRGTAALICRTGAREERPRARAARQAARGGARTRQLWFIQPEARREGNVQPFTRTRPQPPEPARQHDARPPTHPLRAARSRSGCVMRLARPRARARDKERPQHAGRPRREPARRPAQPEGGARAREHAASA